jgi:hypothetical protein
MLVVVDERRGTLRDRSRCASGEQKHGCKSE